MLAPLLLVSCSLEVALPNLVLSPPGVTLSTAVGSVATGEFTVSNGASPSDAAAPYSPEMLLGRSAELPGLTTVGAPFCLHWTAPSCATVVDEPAATGTSCADGAAAGGPRLALPAGCGATVTVVFAPTADGATLGAARVSTDLGPWSTVAAPEVWSQSGDPGNPVQEVAVWGIATAAPHGRLIIDPPLVAMPWRWPDGTPTDLPLTLRNIGTAPLAVGSPSLSCSPAWAVIDAPTPGTAIAAGETAAFTLRHTPTEPDAEVCGLVFGDAADTTSPAAELRFTKDSWGVAPTVTILSPYPGETVPADETVTVSFTLADDDAPPSGIYITIWSAAQGTLGAGVAPDDDGTVWFDVDSGVLQSGADTIRVSLLDWEGFTATDAVAFRVFSPAAEDRDGDSWGYPEGDCDDDNPRAFPGALETGDGIDEDCDGTADDGAPELDNDRDGLTEAEGDCNDHDRDVGPGATETANNTDDDCDALVDENTSRHDDDGDGHSELGNDCDDSDASVNPAATDACDGIDRDCDGVLLTCRADAGGFLSATGDVCHPGGHIELSAFTPDGVAALAWTAEAGDVGADDEPLASLTCPDRLGPLLISLGLTDTDGVQAFDVSTIEVVPADRSLDASVSLPAR